MLKKIFSQFFIFLLKFYRFCLSPFFVDACRHTPTCSQYAIDAIEKHGVLKGFWLSVKRIWRCRPGGTCGYDPVP
ncbi:MAG TPA: membrane protein insertion efficiency factor YidD [Candidatus Omnitrophota bacterium]|nr:membrane protein insertion efficiency factor YidD [Candidatus Omnitrophota bacterium]